MHDSGLDELADEISEIVDKGFSDDALVNARKQLDGLVDDLVSNFEYGIKDQAGALIAGHIQRLAEHAVTALLNGDYDRMRSYLSANENGYTGRNGRTNEHLGEYWNFFEPECMALRRRIVIAHKHIIGQERIKDLEYERDLLRGQVATLKGDLERMRD